MTGRGRVDAVPKEVTRWTAAVAERGARVGAVAESVFSWAGRGGAQEAEDIEGLHVRFARQASGEGVVHGLRQEGGNGDARLTKAAHCWSEADVRCVPYDDVLGSGRLQAVDNVSDVLCVESCRVPNQGLESSSHPARARARATRLGRCSRRPPPRRGHHRATRRPRRSRRGWLAFSGSVGAPPVSGFTTSANWSVRTAEGEVGAPRQRGQDRHPERSQRSAASTPRPSE